MLDLANISPVTVTVDSVGSGVAYIYFHYGSAVGGQGGAGGHTGTLSYIAYVTA